MNLLVHIWESQLKSSKTRQKFKSFIVEVRFVRSTQTSNITRSFFISNWLFHIFLQTKRFRTIPIFEPLPDVNSVTKRKKRRSWFSQNPAVVPVCFPKHPATAPKAVKTLFLLSWSDFPFYFKHWLKIVYLHFYIFRCYQCLRFGKVNFT